MKTSWLFLLMALCLMAGGCGRIYGPVEEAKAYVNDKEDVILQIGKKLEANPTEAGVDEARKIFDSRKGALKAAWQAISDKPQGFNSDWLTMVFDSKVKHDKMLQEIVIKFGTKCEGDCSAARDKLSALEKEFMGLA